MKLNLSFCFIYFVIYSSVRFSLGYDLDVELTIFIEPAKEECFYQLLKPEQNIEVDYQVVSGGQGELNINFHFYSPSGVELISDKQTEDNSHRFRANEDGVHKFCWNNFFSRFNHKLVYFAIYIGDDNDLTDIDSNELEKDDDSYGGMVKTIRDVIVKVHSGLSQVRQTQEVLRANEARDRKLVERNYDRVNSFSFVQIILMIVVGLLQVIMIRGLLDSQSKFSKLWRLFCVIW